MATSTIYATTDNWKYWGTTDGTEDFDLPPNFNELQIIFNIDNKYSTMNIIKDMLDSNFKTFYLCILNLSLGTKQSAYIIQFNCNNSTLKTIQYALLSNYGTAYVRYTMNYANFSTLASKECIIYYQ